MVGGRLWTLDLAKRLLASGAFCHLRGLLGGDVPPVMSSSLGRTSWQMGRGRLGFKAGCLLSAHGGAHRASVNVPGADLGPPTEHRRGEKEQRRFIHLVQRGQHAKVETALGLWGALHPEA